MVGTLLTLTLELQDESEQSSEDTAGLVASAGPGAAGQSLLGRGRTLDESEELEDASVETSGNAPPALSWARFVIGLDQALEAIRKELDARLLQEGRPANADKPDTTLLDQEDAARPADTTSFREQSPWSADCWFETEESQSDSVDAAIGSWGLAEPSSTHSVFPVLPDSTITRSLNRSPRVIELKDGATLFPLDDSVGRSDLVEVQVSRAATMVAISAIAVTGRNILLKRLRSPVSAGSSPSPRSRPRR